MGKAMTKTCGTCARWERTEQIEKMPEHLQTGYCRWLNQQPSAPYWIWPIGASPIMITLSGSAEEHGCAAWKRQKND